VRPITRNAYAMHATDDQVIAVAWQHAESLHSVQPGTFETWVSYPRFRRNTRVVVRFTDAVTGVQYEGFDADVFGYTWIDEHGKAQLTYRYDTEPSWATCSGCLVLHADGTISGCSNDDTPDGCRGTLAIHSGPPTWLTDE